jgi:hypothetical protein
VRGEVDMGSRAGLVNRYRGSKEESRWGHRDGRARPVPTQVVYVPLPFPDEPLVRDSTGRARTKPMDEVIKAGVLIPCFDR